MSSGVLPGVFRLLFIDLLFGKRGSSRTSAFGGETTPRTPRRRHRRHRRRQALYEAARSGGRRGPGGASTTRGPALPRGSSLQ